MQYISHYRSLLGDLLIAGVEEGVTGLWFEGQKYYGAGLQKEAREKSLPVFETARRWLDIYFSGREPDFSVPLRFEGTAFQRQIWEMLCQIPYGQTVTYGQLAKEAARRQGRPSMSSQAVGGAVGRNRISILVPCHRVVGADGSLTGYAGGLERKAQLLALEKM